MAGIGIGMAALLASCSTNREVTRPEPEPVTTERLSEALLTVDDLPEGYSEAPSETTISTELLPEHECDDALGELEPEESVSADFSGPAGQLSSTVAWFPGAGGAVDRLIREIADDCASVVVADQGLSIRTSGLDFGVLSDDTVPIKAEMHPNTGAIEERDLILVREGDLVHLIRLVGPRPSDKSLLDTAVRTAIGRLGELRLLTT